MPLPSRHGPRGAPGPLVRLLAAFWELEPEMAARFWAALAKSTWTRAVGWRQQLQLFEGMKRAGMSNHLLYSASDPAATVEVVEELYREGLLTRLEATRLQERILRRVDATGQWGR